MLDSCDSFGGNPVSTHSRSGAQWILAASSNAIYFPIDLRDDEQLTAYTVSVQKNDTNNPVSVSIVSFNGSTGAEVPQSAGAATPITPGNYWRPFRTRACWRAASRWSGMKPATPCATRRRSRPACGSISMGAANNWWPERAARASW